MFSKQIKLADDVSIQHNFFSTLHMKSQQKTNEKHQQHRFILYVFSFQVQSQLSIVRMFMHLCAMCVAFVVVRFFYSSRNSLNDFVISASIEWDEQHSRTCVQQTIKYRKTHIELKAHLSK